MSTTENVIGELKRLLDAGDFFNTDYEAFEQIIPRIAALVEAAREVNSELMSSGHDGSAPGGGCSLCDAAFKLSAALKGFGNG